MRDSSERIAELAGIFADPTRVKILSLLSEKRQGMSTMDICTRLGLLQPRVSSHLSVLLKNGLVSVTEKGRQRIYTESSSKVSSLLKDFNEISVLNGKKILAPANAIREVRSNLALRQCRSCYDHLAGVTGVELLQELLKSGWLSKGNKNREGKITYRVTKTGMKSLKERGVDVDQALKSNRTFAYGCLDWTERQPHLGGSLGYAILESILSSGIAERKSGTRELRLVKPISSWLNIDQ